MKKNISKNRIELLSPAGDIERLKTAVVFGADAVYCGLPSWSLRNAREITFTMESLKEGIEFAHSHGAKVYITFNVFPHESMLAKLEKDIKNVKTLDIDGVILSDLGTLALVKKHLPKVEIHVSTQANTLNTEAVKMWNELGASRVVLARELTLVEIKEIKKKLTSPFFAKASEGDLNQKIEIEVFGHGAMCMAYSGRCLLSKYYTGREANLGDCAQSCRWKYDIKSQKSKVKSQKYGVPSGQIFIEEETRPGDLLEVQEDDNGTYFMNSRDMCSLDVIDKFIEAGIDSLKIEGRAKTVYYLAVVTGAYRKAIDLYYQMKDKKISKAGFAKKISEIRKELDLVAHRGYSHGFWFGRETYEQEYEHAAFKPDITFLGVVQGSKDGLLDIEVKNKFKVGEKIDLITPDGVFKAKVLEIINSKDKKVGEALTPQERFWVKIDIKKDIPERSIVRKKGK